MREREAVGDATAMWSEEGGAKRAVGDVKSNTAEAMCHATDTVMGEDTCGVWSSECGEEWRARRRG